MPFRAGGEACVRTPAFRKHWCMLTISYITVLVAHHPHYSLDRFLFQSLQAQKRLVTPDLWFSTCSRKLTLGWHQYLSFELYLRFVFLSRSCWIRRRNKLHQADKVQRSWTLLSVIFNRGRLIHCQGHLVPSKSREVEYFLVNRVWYLYYLELPCISSTPPPHSTKNSRDTCYAYGQHILILDS